jgi:hypothetical protein
VEQYIDVAFDLFGCRPIDLAVFLQALFLDHKLLILNPAMCLTLVILEIAGVSFALVTLAQAMFEVLLNRVTFQVNRQERMI